LQVLRRGERRDAVVAAGGAAGDEGRERAVVVGRAGVGVVGALRHLARDAAEGDGLLGEGAVDEAALADHAARLRAAAVHVGLEAVLDAVGAGNQNRLDLAKIVRQLVILSYITKTPPHVGVTIIHELNTT
jgi:hypothetical protein